MELAAELTVGQLAGTSPLPDPLPLGRRLEERFAYRVRTLPRETQTLLLLASAQQLGDPEQLWRAAKSLGIPPEAADLPELDRLIAFKPRVVFRHPLMRSAVYQGASAHQRRQAHEALAAVSDPERDADRRAWHLAAAAVGPDEEVAAELERSADQARHRGGYAATAAFLRRAVDLTPDTQRRAVRGLHAAVKPSWQLARRPWPPTYWRRRRRRWPGLSIARRRGASRPAFGSRRASAAPSGEPLGRGARFRSTRPHTRTGNAQGGLRSLALRRTRGWRGRNRRDRPCCARDAALARYPRVARRPAPGRRRTPRRHYQAGAHLLQRAIQRLVGDDAADGREIAKFADLGFMAALELQDDEHAQALSSRVLKLARERGDLMALLAALGCQTQAEVLAGRFSAAEAALAEGRNIASATGNIGVFGSAGIMGLRLLAWRGEEARTRNVAAAATAEAMERGAGGHVVAVRVQVATLELALGNYARASGLLRPVYEEDAFYAGTTILPDLIEAASRTDVRAAGRGRTRAAVRTLPRKWH